jgi:hypothetical protein
MKITHFTQKAWLITWERSGGGFGCQQYGICGIYNKKNLAEIAIDKLKAESIKSKFSQIDYKLQEVGLNENKQLFSFDY